MANDLTEAQIKLLSGTSPEGREVANRLPSETIYNDRGLDNNSGGKFPADGHVEVPHLLEGIIAAPFLHNVPVKPNDLLILVENLRVATYGDEKLLRAFGCLLEDGKRIFVLIENKDGNDENLPDWPYGHPMLKRFESYLGTQLFVLCFSRPLKHEFNVQIFGDFFRLEANRKKNDGYGVCNAVEASKHYKKFKKFWKSAVLFPPQAIKTEEMVVSRPENEGGNYITVTAKRVPGFTLSYIDREDIRENLCRDLKLRLEFELGIKGIEVRISKEENDGMLFDVIYPSSAPKSN